MAFRLGRYTIATTGVWNSIGDLAKRVGAAVDMKERGRLRSDFESAFGEDYNPNELIRKEGLKVVKDILSDDAAKSGSQIVKLAITAPGYDIEEPKSDHPDAQQATDLVRWTFTNLPGTFRSKQKAALRGRDEGYSLMEICWGDIAEGPHRGYIGWTNLKPKPADGYRFVTDEFGNVLGMRRKDDFAWRSGEKPPLQMDKWIHYAHDAEEVSDSPYGCPQVIPAHPYWKARRIIFRKRGIFVERYASGHPVLKHKVAMNQKEIDNYEKIIKHLMTGTGVRVDENVTDLNFWSPTGSAFLEFGRFDDFCAASILRSMLVPTQLGLGPETHVGSQAKATVHQQVFGWVTGDMDDAVITAIQEQGIQRLCDANFELKGNYPQFRRKPIDTEDAVEIVSTMVESMKNGAWGPLTLDAVNRSHRALGYPELTQKQWDEWVADKPDPLKAGQLNQGRTPIPPEQRTKGAQIQVPNDAPGMKPKVEPGPQQTEHDRALVVEQRDGRSILWLPPGLELASPGGTPGRETENRITRGTIENPHYYRELTSIEKAVKLKPRAVEEFYDSAVSESMHRIGQAMDRVKHYLLRDLDRAGLLQSTANEANVWTFDKINARAKKQFNEAVHSVLVTGRVYGARFAKEWTENGLGHEVTLDLHNTTHVELDDEITSSMLIDPREAREYFANLIPMSRAAAEAMKAQAFWVTGLYLDGQSGTMLADVKQIIDKAFRSGQWGRVESRISELFDTWIDNGKLTPSGQLFTPWHAHAIARNAIARSFNAGSHDFYYEAREWIQGFMWSSVIDERTTRHCEMMDGETYRMGQVEPPPAHHLCRSFEVPITLGEEWKPTSIEQLAKIGAMRDPDFASGVPIYA